MGTYMRTYEKTHPWITFRLNLQKAPPSLWICLGEARSKCGHLSGVPLKPEIARILHQVYLAKGIHATAAIEGNTLSERQVLERMRGKRVVGESQRYLEQETDNILEAANSLLEEIEESGVTPITSQRIKSFNETILKNLELDEGVIPGKYREYTVGVMDYEAPSWQDCDHLMNRLCDWLNGEDFASQQSDDALIYGIIKSVVAHLYLAWIHPFGDGNGRTARLLEVKFLMEAGVPSAAAHLLSNHYNRTRTEYYRRLSEASKNGGDITNFLLYATKGLVDQLREQLDIVRRQQWGVAWQNFIYERFGSEKTPSDKRQIALLLDLSKEEKYIAKNKIKELSPRLATLYADKTFKTLTRDLNKLEDMGFLEITPEGVRAKKELILAFLPRIKKKESLEQEAEIWVDDDQAQLDFLALFDK